MGRRRPARLVIVGAVLLASALLGPAGGCGSKALKDAAKPRITRSNGGTPLRQKYDRLRKGMTDAEVVALMGEPAVRKADDSGGFNLTIYTCAEEKWRAVVVVSGKHGLLIAHNNDDPSFGK